MLVKLIFFISLQSRITGGGTVQPEWRNGRRDGLKIHCPLKAWGFESPLGHWPGHHGRAFSCPRGGLPISPSLLHSFLLPVGPKEALIWAQSPMKNGQPGPNCPSPGPGTDGIKLLYCLFAVLSLILTGFGSFSVSSPDFSLILTAFAPNPVKNNRCAAPTGALLTFLRTNSPGSRPRGGGLVGLRPPETFFLRLGPRNGIFWARNHLKLSL